MATRGPRRWLKLRNHDDAVRARAGVRYLCGIDEAGRGPLAGPVVAAAVILPERVKLPGLDDSKKLTPDRRDELDTLIRSRAIGIGWACVGPRTIERLNILSATLLAMRRAVIRLAARTPPEYLVIDGRDCIPGVYWRQEPIVEGDGHSLSVAAASVVAKTIRDRIMSRIHVEYPEYGFDRNKGYGTPDHLAAIERIGPCAWHRFTYSPVRQTELLVDPTLLEPSGA